MSLDYFFSKPKKAAANAVSGGIKASETQRLAESANPVGQGNTIAVSPTDKPDTQIKKQVLHTPENQGVQEQSQAPVTPDTQAKNAVSGKDAKQTEAKAIAQQIVASNEQSTQAVQGYAVHDDVNEAEAEAARLASTKTQEQLDEDVRKAIEQDLQQLRAENDKRNNDPLEIYRQAERYNVGTQEQRERILEQAADKGDLSYTQMYELLNPRPDEESDEDRKKREKREKRDAIIRSIGDGLSAIARLYFGSRGVGIAHDPKNDLTYADNQRREQMRQELKKNKAAWLTGYQKAREMDLTARSNRDKLEETKHHNRVLEGLSGFRANQAGIRLDQNQQKIDLNKVKIENDKEYKDAMVAISQAQLDHKITDDEAKNEIARLRLAKASASAEGKDSLKGYWYQYYEMMDNDPGMRTKVRKMLRKLNQGDKVTNTNIKYILDHLDDDKPAQSTQTTTPAASKPKTAAKPQNTTQAVKKRTPVSAPKQKNTTQSVKSTPTQQKPKSGKPQATQAQKNKAKALNL